MPQLTFLFDSSLCSGCFSCVVACQDQNDFAGNDIAFRKVTAYESGQYPDAIISYVSTACFHCGDAPCIMVCPTGAISKNLNNGIVTVNREVCVSCHSCELACPFGSPKFADDGHMIKCDMCSTGLDNAMIPACARACPTGALGIGTLDEVSELKTKEASIKILGSFTMSRPIKR